MQRKVLYPSDRCVRLGRRDMENTWDYAFIMWFKREWSRITEQLKATGEDFSKVEIVLEEKKVTRK